jgi:hypothetical protein
VAASTVLCLVITPYNANPRTPRGMEIVERVRRVSPQLVSQSTVIPMEVDAGSPALPVDAQGVPGVVPTPPSTPCLQRRHRRRRWRGDCYSTCISI